jgi:hypothetical protein
MKRSHAILLVLVSAVLSHALAPAVAWAQAKLQAAALSITSSSGLSGEGTASSPLACTAATASAAGCVSTSAQTFGGNKTILGAAGQNPNSKLLTVGNPDAGVNLLTQDTEGMLTVHGTDGAAEATPLIYFYSSTASPYHALKFGSGADPNSNWHWTLGSSGTVPYFRSRANGLALDLAGNGALYPATSAASDNGASANRWRSLYLSGDIYSASTKTSGSCTLNGASPSTCTATVIASAKCVCAAVGTTAAIAGAACAVSLSSTTLTITGPNGATNDANYICISP